MQKLYDTVATLHHIGAKSESKLRRLGIETIGDLLWHLPQRYEDLRTIHTIASLKPDEKVTIRGTIQRLTEKRLFRRRMTITEIDISDDTGRARAVWFNQPYVCRVLKKGDEVYVSGKTQPNLLKSHFTNPVYEKVKAKDEQLHTAQIVPFYSLTEGISHKQLRFLIQTAFKKIDDYPDELPQEIIESEHFPPLLEALKQVHFPKQRQQPLESAIQRLKFEELFWMQLGVGYVRKFYEDKEAPVILFREEEIKKFIRSLPFTLTTDQKRSAWDAIKDLARSHPMNRLVQGDVGSGKTVVASLIILNTVLNEYQSALMAPTEVLAVQHYRELQKLLPKLSIALLTAKNHFIQDKESSRTKIIKSLGDGSIDVIVGTHSLIQEGVRFKKLGLVIIDEQHRFGVAQRQRLTTLSLSNHTPHLLSLTATPIPRTLALTLYGDLDISTIREMPLGRKPIITRQVAEDERDKTYSFIKEQIAANRQVFILCPLIEGDDMTESKSVMTEYEHLKAEIFPDLTVKYLHGKLKSTEKKQILRGFQENKFPILVTTSVIEVGIDIPNATIMVIEGAERFGLAQLHQFRGRVGRSDMQSYCFLFSSKISQLTKQRLQLLVKHNDGFLLAEEDLKLRGEGELFGTRQSGIINFKIATIHDTELIKKTRDLVQATIKKDKDLKFYNSIKHKLQESVSHRE